MAKTSDSGSISIPNFTDWFSNWIGSWFGGPGNSSYNANYVPEEDDFNIGRIRGEDVSGANTFNNWTDAQKAAWMNNTNGPSWYQNADGSVNLQGIGESIAGLAKLGSTVGNLIMSNKAHDMMKDQFKFQKNMAMNNYNNSLKQYNTRLADVANNRTQFSGNDHSQWYEDNKL